MLRAGKTQVEAEQAILHLASPGAGLADGSDLILALPNASPGRVCSYARTGSERRASVQIN